MTMVNVQFNVNQNNTEQVIDVLNDDEILIFLHLMKTGGTTLFRLIDQHYSEKQTFHYIPKKEGHQIVNLEEKLASKKSSIKFIHGHTKFGFHKHLHQPAQYITMLREPISRVVSLYYFTHHNPNRDIPPHKHCPTLSSYLDTHLKAFNNNQTRAIAGPQAVKVPFGEEPPEMLELAKQNLEQFLMVGITERFDESVIVLKYTLGLQHILYSRINENSQRPTLDKIAIADIERIQEYNTLDLQLYDYANKLLDQKIGQLGNTFPNEYKDFSHSTHQFNSVKINAHSSLESTQLSLINQLKYSIFNLLEKAGSKFQKLWKSIN